MSNTTLIEVRRAKPSDAAAIASTHDDAWRAAYQGIIPGPELEKLINRRGPDWWDSAIRKGSRIAILVFGDTIAGYANYGRNRARSLYYDGEIYELYLRPEFQGLGFGRKLFSAARRDLGQSGLYEPRGVGARRTTRPRWNSIVRSAAARLRAHRSGSAPRCSTRSPTPGTAKTAEHMADKQRADELRLFCLPSSVRHRSAHIQPARNPATAVLLACRQRAPCWRAGRR